MKSPSIVALIGIILMTVVQAQRQQDDERFERRQSDFNFPGPRRQQNLPVFASDGGRPRSRPSSFQPVVESEEGVIDDGGSFQEEEPQLPPSRSFRPSSSDLPRFSSRPQSVSSHQDDSGTGGKLSGGAQELLEEEIKPEPDRLELLLKDSKFSCSSKKQGYYADDGLSCEVFHYCNEGVRHSWMCPAGTAFHQIHLICMQEGSDNICKQSSKYYIVNDYLYKPLTESTRESNGTIRYADRYYPNEHEQVDDGSLVGGGLRDDGQSFHQDGVSQQEDISDFQRPQHRPRPQFFDLPPPQPSRSSGSSSGRFRPSTDGSSQFRPSHQNSDFSSDSRAPHVSNEDLGAGSTFGSEEDSRVHFLPPQNTFRSGVRRQSARGQQFPHFDRS